MDEFNELKIAFSRKHLKVAAWCMDGSRAKYTFKAHPQNQYFFDRNVIEDILQREGFTRWAWEGTKPVIYVPIGCRKRFSVIRNALQNRTSVFHACFDACFDACLVATAAAALLIYFR